MLGRALLRQASTRTSGRFAASRLAAGPASLRWFSASPASVEKSIQKLSKALEKEIKYENENYAQLDDIETYLNESQFKFAEEENGVTMTLTKQVGEKLVEVQFEAR